jgi:hypothetical protein
MNNPSPIIPEIIDQHAEEAAFLWLRRDAAVHQPHYDIEDLAELDERVEAHLDGLRPRPAASELLLKYTKIHDSVLSFSPLCKVIIFIHSFVIT